MIIKVFAALIALLVLYSLVEQFKQRATNQMYHVLSKLRLFNGLWLSKETISRTTHMRRKDVERAVFELYARGAISVRLSPDDSSVQEFQYARELAGDLDEARP